MSLRAIPFAAVAISVCWFTASSIPFAGAKAENHRLSSYFKEGCKLAQEGKWKQAIELFLEGGSCQPEAAYHWRREIFGVASARPFDPNAHAAIGLAYRLPPHYLIEGKSNGHLSNYNLSSLELRQASRLAEPSHNTSALIYLGDVIGFHKRSKEKCSARRNLFEEILFCRWKPNFDEQFNLTWLTGEGCLKIPSISSAFNWNASDAFRSAKSEFPELDWDADYLFASEKEGKFVQRIDHGCVGRIANFVRGGATISAEDDRQIALKYINKCWTPKQIKSYCIPATERPSFMRTEPGYAAGRCTGKFILLPENIEVNWDAEIYNGKGLFYTVWAERGKSFWLLQNDKPDAVDQSDDTFLLRRISDAVFLSIKKLELANVDALISQVRSNRRKSNSPEEKLVFDTDQRPAAYTCFLTDGKKLVASFDRNESIVSITVDGKLDETWTNAITNVQHSNELLSWYDATGSSVSFRRRGGKHAR